MTAQIPDTFLLQDQKFSIVGVNGSGLFDPLQYNMQPRPRLTSCWRGFVCTYKTLYNKFLLDALQVNLQHEGPAINTVKPVFSQQGTFENTYSSLNLPVDFTGGILTAREFLQGLYVHMGFHPAWKYRYVFELVISHGDVIETRDVSERMQEIRHEMVKSPLEPDADATREQIDDWIASTFKLNYNF
jgi:hypothetical protein